MENRTRVRVRQPAPAPSPAEDEKPYEVGYGKPPREHRFRPNQSGNLKGRPKGARNTAETAKNYLDGSVTVRERGRPRKMNRRELLIHQLYERAAKGDNRAAGILLDLDAKARGQMAPTPADTIDEHITDASDLAILERFAQSMRAGDAS